MTAQIVFGVIATVLLGSSLMVVTSRNLVHTVFWLGLTLASTAVIFVTLEAPFLAGIQLLLYTGGVLTLMLFGVMMTRRGGSLDVPNEQASRPRGALIAAAMFGVLAGAVFRTEGLPTAAAGGSDTAAIGESFLTTHLLAFEVLSILLLAALVGAIALGRKLDARDEKEIAAAGAELSRVPFTGPRAP